VVDERFARIFRDAEPTVVARLKDVVGTSGNPLTSKEIGEIHDLLTAAEPAVAAFHDVAEEWVESSEALQAYNKMLAQLRVAFDELVALSNDPFATGGAIDRLVAGSNSIREYAIEVRDALAVP
jgi:hypothetical protein